MFVQKLPPQDHIIPQSFDVSSATLGSLLKSLCQEADRCSYVQMLSQKLYDSGSLGDECE